MSTGITTPSTSRVLSMTLALAESLTPGKLLSLEQSLLNEGGRSKKSSRALSVTLSTWQRV